MDPLTTSSTTTASRSDVAIISPDALKKLITQRLSALKAGLREGKQHIDDIIEFASNPHLKNMLRQGKQTSEHWAQRVERAMQTCNASGDGDNPIIKPHVQVAERMRR